MRGSYNHVAPGDAGGDVHPLNWSHIGPEIISLVKLSITMKSPIVKSEPRYATAAQAFVKNARFFGIEGIIDDSQIEVVHVGRARDKVSQRVIGIDRKLIGRICDFFPPHAAHEA